MPYPISMSLMKDSKNKYTIKVGNFVPGLIYLLGPYKLPVISENLKYYSSYHSFPYLFFITLLHSSNSTNFFRDQTSICVIPEHPINLLTALTKQILRINPVFNIIHIIHVIFLL